MEKNINQRKKEEYYEISFFFLFITATLTIITYKSFGGFASFLTLGMLFAIHFLFSEIKLCKPKKLYKIDGYKYAEYGKNAC